ncbi:probable manganese-transporting ATPase PDR2 [Tanacetum coccineum]|uniref:Probable manganese-transporting ATPase PDR2 n=1 Tax=Tanacetum coccineum TaxID=301880 RepID=A0ABQ4WDN9_9ASTR
MGNISSVHVRAWGGCNAVQIVQRHHFASHLKRMAVVVRTEEQFYAFVKGATETIQERLNDIPAFYVSEARNLDSDVVEIGLTFAGFAAEPRKICIYREEAIDTLVSCLKCTDSPATQIAASDTILALQGRFSSSGKPLVRTYLLKLAAISVEVQETMVCFNVQSFTRVKTRWISISIRYNFEGPMHMSGSRSCSCFDIPYTAESDCTLKPSSAGGVGSNWKYSSQRT